MSKRSDCIKNTKQLEDGFMIEGHIYEAMIAAYDRDTDRTYIFDQCEHCGKRTVSWCEGKDESVYEYYPSVVKLGGHDV